MASGWHRNDDDWVQHPKTVALQELLNEPLADAYVERLRCWAGRFRVRGRFENDVVRHMETLCGWRGEPGKLLAALVATGWVDERTPGKFEVHDWWEKQGPLVEKAEKDAERKRRERRGRVRRDAADASADGPMDGRADGAGTNETNETYETDGTNAPRARAAAMEPAKPPSTTDGSADGFWAWANDRRRASGQVGEHPPQGLSGWWSGVLMELGGDIGRAERAYEHFLADPHWRKEGCPFAAFRKQWPKYAGEHYGKQSAKKPPPRDAPVEYGDGFVKLPMPGDPR